MEHRAISVHSVNYRIYAGIWWRRFITHAMDWLHPSAFGSIPARECLEAAWDVQADVEAAMVGQKEFTLITADYQNFFDTFEPHFFARLCKAVGFPEHVADLVCSMNTTMMRVVKIGPSFGTPFAVNIGAGQGDSFSVICALMITTIQFRHVGSLHPNVSLTSVVDDRTFRGPRGDVIAAVRTALAYDDISTT